MSAPVPTSESQRLRALVDAHREAFDEVLMRYGATDPKIFGSVARGTAHAGSDIDILVEMDPSDGNVLMRASGLLEEVRTVLGSDVVDIFPAQLLRETVHASAHAQAVAL